MEIQTSIEDSSLPIESNERKGALGSTVLLVLGLLGIAGGLCELTADPVVGGVALCLGLAAICSSFIMAGEQLRR